MPARAKFNYLAAIAKLTPPEPPFRVGITVSTLLSPMLTEPSMPMHRPKGDLSITRFSRVMSSK